MRKLIIPVVAFLVLSATVARGDWSGWESKTKSGNYTFPDSTTLNKLTVQGKAAFEDTVDVDDATFSGRLYGADFQQFDTLPLDSITGYCTFTFDDGLASQYDSVFPVFTDSGIVGVSAIHISSHTMGGTGWTRVTEMANAGWEIASHSMTHTDLTTIPQDSVDWELRISKDSLNAHGFDVESFVYPGGAYNELVLKRVAKYYKCARTTAGAIETSPINTYSLQGHVWYYDSTTYKAKAQIDTAATKKGWVILYLGAISTTAVSTDSLKTIIKYVNTKGLRVITLKQGRSYMSNPYDSYRFAIGRDGKVKIGSTISNRNIYIGVGAGKMSTQSDSDNVVVGYSAGANLTAKYNTLLGAFAGLKLTTGASNVMVGRGAGKDAATASNNVYIGRDAGTKSRVGSSNVYVGYLAGEDDSNGVMCTYIGTQSGLNIKSGYGNTLVGYQTLYNNTAGQTNVALGSEAGYTTTGNGNIFIGWRAGYYATGSSHLYLQNDSSTTKPLIYGNFASKTLHFARTGNDTIIHIDTTQFRSVINNVQIIKWDSLGLTGSAKIRGTDTFGGEKTADTVVIVGATASDYYWIQGKGATPWTQPLGYVAKIDSLIVNCVVGDTAKALASGYNWLRIK